MGTGEGGLVLGFQRLDDHAQTSSTHSQEADLLARKRGFLWLRRDPDSQFQSQALSPPLFSSVFYCLYSWCPSNQPVPN